MSTLTGTLALPQAAQLIEKHRAALETAVAALRRRTFHEHFAENPKAYPETAAAEGQAAYDAQLGKPFTRLKQKADGQLTAHEKSPYTGQPLGITYPSLSSPEAYVAAAREAFGPWRKTSPEARCALLMEALERLKADFFELALATQHTTGQGYMMAFQASGPHAADRATEAVALAWHEQTAVPEHLVWDKPMGKFNITLDKYYRIVPKGISLAVACSTFPTWNSVPGIFASLATGNPVIIKPHPTVVYPLALVVARLQEVFTEQGLPAEIVQLAPDTPDAPITKVLAEHPDIKIIDYTGGNAFGDYIEALPGKITFTEKAGVNSVIIDSTTDLQAMVNNLAFSVSLYSGQMCTRPQNFFIPKDGIKVGDQHVSFDEVADAFAKAVQGLSQHPKAGPAVCGALQNADSVKNRLNEVASKADKVWLASVPIANPEFPAAQTAGPLVVQMSVEKLQDFAHEWFGPIAILIPTENTAHSVELAQSLARQHGAISCGAYTTNPETLNHIADAMADVATPVSFNLLGQIYVNQNAAFSDFHVTGGNPAGNATFTDTSFVTKRFNFVGLRIQN
jgi:phenylacetic acid degradation protein paaN